MLFRKLIRTIGKYKAQFLSMIVMIALGVGVFVGFNIEWYSLEKDGNSYFEEQNYADYRVYSETGFSEAELEALQDIDGVDKAVRFLSVNTDVKDSKKSLTLCVTEEQGVSDFLVTEQKKDAKYGEDSKGMWLSDRYAKENNISLGDKVTVVYQGTELTEEVVGLIKSPEFAVCVSNESQIMPDYKAHGYFYISAGEVERCVGKIFYPQINILSKLSQGKIEKKVNSALGRTTYLTGKKDSLAYAAMDSEVEEGKTLGSILPVMFLLIAILTMVTTMHRITVNEKTQIGTLKALGFRDKRILRHYTSYGLLIGILGTALGFAVGYGVARYLLNSDSSMGQYLDFPSWKLYMPGFGWTTVLALIVFLTLIGYLSVKRMLKGSAADALQPYVPKKIKKTALEKTSLWNRFSFGTRWNLRDISRHKARSFMTLFGVVGCMILLVGGMGMKDTMDAFMDVYYDKSCNYETKVNFSDDAPNEEIEKLAKKYDGDWVASASVQMDGETVSFEVYNLTNDNHRLVDSDEKLMTLTDDGAYVCQRLKEKAAVGKEISIFPYGSEQSYQVKVKGLVRSVSTKNIAVTKEYADKQGIPYHITSMYTKTKIKDIEDSQWIADKATKSALSNSMDSFMGMFYACIFALGLFAIILSVVVLYNLGVMSYVERYRELATLKVVGFRDRQIADILIKQNVWLTLLGILLGIPAGYGTISYLMVKLGSEYEMRTVCGPLTWSVSIILTLGVAILVSYFVARKSRKIDMVEALKGTE